MSCGLRGDSRTLLVILGNQLFPLKQVLAVDAASVFMAEDAGLCTYVRHHKQKLVLFLASMRAYADELRKSAVRLTYLQLTDRPPGEAYEDSLAAQVHRLGCTRLIFFEIEDRFFEERIRRFAEHRGLVLEFLPSPMFLTSRAEFASYLHEVDKPLMADFYSRQRRRLKLLLDDSGRPLGGKWSFDSENRRKVPPTLSIPTLGTPEPTRHVSDVSSLIEERFADHPGATEGFWLPTTRRQALRWLDEFLDTRLANFGAYEDALTEHHPFVFHSVLSPMLNLGLITPGELLQRTLGHAKIRDIPLNSLEGFIRQIAGWREFVRGIDRHFGRQQERANFWKHSRGFTDHWYKGTTGLYPLDLAISKALRFGWVHHIERLMILGNLMLLCEIAPNEVFRWFMEMFVDSADWVMGPNVYGMALFSDGGVFATKPYICASSYLLRMSDYQRGAWCDIVDGLYWRFVERHRDFFNVNPRLSVMTGALDRLDRDRKRRIFAQAEDFLARVTVDRPARSGIV